MQMDGNEKELAGNSPALTSKSTHAFFFISFSSFLSP
jgi:hypothetical protein